MPRRTTCPTGLLLALTLAACSSSPPPRPITAPSLGPERIVARSVPTIDGLPHAVKSGLTVQLAGMVPVDSAGRLVAADDLAGQTRQVMTNLAAVLRAARGLPSDLTQLTVYLRDPSPEAVLAVRGVILESTGRETPPALVIVGTTALPEPAMQVMISGVAQLRSEFLDRQRMR